MYQTSEKKLGGRDPRSPIGADLRRSNVKECRLNKRTLPAAVSQTVWLPPPRDPHLKSALITSLIGNLGVRTLPSTVSLYFQEKIEKNMKESPAYGHSVFYVSPTRLTPSRRPLRDGKQAWSGPAVHTRLYKIYFFSDFLTDFVLNF